MIAVTDAWPVHALGALAVILPALAFLGDHLERRNGKRRVKPHDLRAMWMRAERIGRKPYARVHSAWPVWALVLFAAAAIMRALPAGYVRAVAVLPIVLLVPGSLTVGAAFGDRDRPRGTVFVGYATLLSVLWSAFVSLALYILHILITATSTYFGMLAVCAVLAAVAQVRLLIERSAIGCRVAPSAKLPDTEARGTSDESGAEGRTPRFATIVAVVAGVSLLAGGVYFYDHLPRPAPMGYTQLAWASTRTSNAIAVGRTGTRLYFEVADHQSSQARFRVSAAWEGSSARSLAKPLTFTLGPDNKTFQGDVFVPPPPGGCTYRIVITLAGIEQAGDPTWSINANVYKSGTLRKACAS